MIEWCPRLPPNLSKRTSPCHQFWQIRSKLMAQNPNIIVTNRVLTKTEMPSNKKTKILLVTAIYLIN